MFSFLYHWQYSYWTWRYIWVTRRVSYKKQDLLTFREHLSSPPVFWWVLCCSYCYHIICLYVLSPCCAFRYDFRMKTMFRTVILSLRESPTCVPSKSRLSLLIRVNAIQLSPFAPRNGDQCSIPSSRGPIIGYIFHKKLSKLIYRYRELQTLVPIFFTIITQQGIFCESHPLILKTAFNHWNDVPFCLDVLTTVIILFNNLAATSLEMLLLIYYNVYINLPQFTFHRHLIKHIITASVTH